MFHKLINQLENCQLKFSSEEKGVFEGYASTFNTVDQVGDTIIKGAFAETISSGRVVKGFVNHKQHEVPVIDWMSLREDSHGLKVHGKVDMNHKDGPTVYSGLQRKAMDGLSIGFTMNPGDFVQKQNGREIKNLDLMEISVVSFPCERQATITAVKSDIELLASRKDAEDFLRNVGGFSASMAKVLVSQIKQLTRNEWEAEQITDQASRELLAVIHTLKSKL